MNVKKCLKGTLRFNGYCACWSGAWSQYCTMDVAVAGDTVPTPWALADLIVPTDPQFYHNLDQADMKNVNFEANFTGHPTCPVVAS